MNNKLKAFTKKHKKLLIFIPIYILFIVLTELVMGFGFGDNKAWEKGKRWAGKGE